VCAKGVSWNVGRTFFRDDEVYRFTLAPEPDHQRPGMINLQQYHLEELLVRRCEALGVPIRWKHKVTALSTRGATVRLAVDTVDGPYDLKADWVIAADGARSPLRTDARPRYRRQDLPRSLPHRRRGDGGRLSGRALVLVRPAVSPQPERAAAQAGGQRLAHRLPVGLGCDPEEEKKPERVLPRIRAMLGDQRAFELEWVSVYTFQCRRMQKFRHGRVLFVGDAAHQVSPFGARGANSGIQDTDNLVWKLRLVHAGLAPDQLLDSYSDERVAAADENILNSTRSTDFITPKSDISRVFRDAVLDLARTQPFARKLVNSGRLSVPCVLMESALNTPDRDAFAGWMVPGAPADDAPVAMEGREGWLLPLLGGRFQLLVYVDDAASAGARSSCLPRAMFRRSRSLRSPARRARCRGCAACTTCAAASRSATTRSPAVPGCCGPISTSQRAGARSTPPRCRQRCCVRSARRRRRPLLCGPTCRLRSDGDAAEHAAELSHPRPAQPA
jgi:3-(3-hydroxy-phenyl)propionate hydroxylase